MSSQPAPTAGGPPVVPKPAASYGSWIEVVARCAVTAVMVGGYYGVQRPLTEWAGSWYTKAFGQALDPATPRVIGVVLLLSLVVFVWRRVVLRDPRFHAPLLVTTILLVGDAAFNILDDHPAPRWLVELTHGIVLGYSPTVLAILCTILVEMVVGRFFWGKWPHLASAYITGISVGILIKSPALWPFILCGLISITSKYVLRVCNRHLWNPSNFGVTAMLLLAPAEVASLNVQAGNNLLAVVVIWGLGGLIMYRLKRFHIPVAFNVAFVLLSIFRAWVEGTRALTDVDRTISFGARLATEMAWMTFPMFQLYIFFMITDPPTTTRRRWSRILVAVLVAVTDTILRLGLKDVHSLYHALFIMAPLSNLVEIYYDRRAARRKQCVPAVVAAAVPAPLSPVVPQPATAAAE